MLKHIFNNTFIIITVQVFMA